MKKILALLFALSFVLVSCKGWDEQGQEWWETKTGETSEATTEWDTSKDKEKDWEWNDKKDWEKEKE